MRENIRVIVVFIVGIGEALLLYLFGDKVVIYLKQLEIDNYAWLSPILTILIASPIAFLVWSFRNSDKRKDQQHTEENIRQSDFHKIEEWATNFPTLSEINETQYQETAINKEGNLQIAAIYQLLPYLKGEYGDRFVRPSMEIYHSLLASWKLSQDDKNKIFTQFNVNQMESVRRPNYINAIYTIFHQELIFFNSFHKKEICIDNNWVPLKNIDLKFFDLKYLNLRGINLFGADLSYSMCLQSNFQGANLRLTDFDCSVIETGNFQEAKLEFANFTFANLSNADLRNAKFQLTQFKLAQLQGANFRGTNIGRAYFYKANLRNAIFRGANLKNAHFIEELPLRDNILFEDKQVNVNFQEANLENANFQNANLEGAIFAGALNIDEAIFDPGVFPVLPS